LIRNAIIFGYKVAITLVFVYFSLRWRGYSSSEATDCHWVISTSIIK